MSRAPLSKENKFQSLFETMALGVTYQNATGEIIDANPAAQQILGLTLEQMQGKTSMDPNWKCIHEDGSDFLGETHPSMVALKTKKEVNDVIMGVFNPKTNGYRWLKTNAYPQFRNSEKKPYQVFTTFDDITNERQAQQSLKELYSKYQNIIHTANIAIFELDKHGKYTFVNSAWQDLFGYKSHEVLGKDKEMILSRDEASPLLFKELKYGKIRNYNQGRKYYTKNGKTIWCDLFVAANNDLKGNLKSIVGVIVDITNKKESEDEIREKERLVSEALAEVERSENLLNETGKLAKVGAWELDLKTMTPYFSDETYRIYEIPIGKPPKVEDSIKFYAPEARPLIQKAVTEAIENHTPYEIEVPFITAKGKNIWVRTYGQVEVKNGKSIRLYGAIQDVTELKKSTLKLQKSEQRFKALVQEGSDLIGILDAEGNYRYVSPTSTSVLGITPEEFIGRNAREFIHPDDVERVLASLEKITTANKVIVDPFRFQNYKKDWRWLETVLTNMLDNPEVNGIVANSRDITYKIEEERKLKLLESVAMNTKDAILITEAEPFDEPGNRIIYVNEAFTKMTGYQANEVIGKSPRILQGPNSDREELAKLGQALRKWKPYEMTTVNYKKNGEEFWINFTVTPVADEKGWYTHWIAIERDVTEQKTKELEKDFITKISNIFHECVESDLTGCLSKLCEHMTKFGGFDFAEIWLPAIDGKTINRVSSYVEGKAGTVFYNSSKNLDSFTLGEAIPGYVWKNKTTEIWEDIDEEWRFFKRKVAAKKAGIKAVMGLPLKHKEEVIGVLLLGTKKTKSALAQYSGLFQKLESTIGAELSRKKTEIELAQIFNFTPDMICVAGFDGYLKRINPAGLKLLGYSLEEMRSKPIKSFIHEDDKLLTSKKQKELYRGKNLRNFENRYITKQGQIVWLSWTSTSAPEHGIVYSVAKNITEEKNLRELNRLVGRLTKIGSWEVDLVNETVYWSDEVHKLYETDPNSFVPNVEDAINFYRDDFRQMAQSKFEKCISNREPYDIEAVIVTSSKKELWVRTTAKAEFVDDVCTRIYGSFQDIDDRKQSEMRLQSLADNLPGVAYQYIIYPDGTDALKYVTKGSQQVWGFSPKQVLENVQLVWNGILAGGDLEEFQKSISDSIASKTKWTARYRYLMPTGEMKTLLGNGSPKILADGTIIFNSVILDVTNETKNEELLKQISKIARIGSWEMDLTNQDSDSIYWSPMLFEMVELDASYTPTLTSGIEFHIGESKERIQKALHLLITDGIEFDEEILLRTAKGNERWSRAIGKSKVVNNKRTKIYGSYQDIHEQKVAAIALEESLKALKDYKYSLDQSAIIAFTDHKGVITYVNDNFCKISKYSRKEILGKTHRLINSKHHPKQFFKKLWKTIASGKVWRGEIKNKAKDSSFYWVDTTIVPFLDEKNKPVQYLAIRFDITARKEAENKMNQYRKSLQKLTTEMMLVEEKQRKEIAVNIHDHLSQSLVISKMKLTDLQKEPQTDEKRKEIGIIIKHISEALENTRKITYDLSPPVLYELGLIEAIHWLAEKIEDENHINVQFETQLSDINLTEPKLILIYRAVQEILTNAIKHSGTDQIHILFTKYEYGLQIVIKDKGRGFNTASLNTQRQPNTGFGLFAVKERLENLKGNLSINSSLGLGTEIKMFVPLKDNKLL